jgi:hypothetical protein
MNDGAYSGNTAWSSAAPVHTPPQTANHREPEKVEITYRSVRGHQYFMPWVTRSMIVVIVALTLLALFSIMHGGFFWLVAIVCLVAAVLLGGVLVTTFQDPDLPGVDAALGES